MTNEKCYLMGKFARVGLGTRHIDYNGRLCMSSAAVAYAKAFGIDRSPLPMPDIALADCMLVVGSNVAECFPIVMQWIWRARDNGAQPDRARPARDADRPHRRPLAAGAPGHRHRRAERHAAPGHPRWAGGRGVPAPRAPPAGTRCARRSSRTRPRCAERIAGVPAERIVAAARLYGRAPTSLIMHARGIEHSTHGVNNCLACINLALARGQVGKPGGGTMMITGQGNGQGGREVGQKANQLPGYRHIDVPEERAVHRRRLGHPGAGAAPGGRGRDRDGPADGRRRDQELPGHLLQPDGLAAGQRGRRSGRSTQLDPLVVIDFFLSETAELADVVLPGSVWCEDEGTTTNLEGRVVKINQAAEPPGEARRDWEIVCRAGPAARARPVLPVPLDAREIWDELRVASKGGVADYYGITWEKIDAQDGVFWPCPTEDHPGTPRLFTERFGHPDGRATHVRRSRYAPPAEEPSGDYPFRLTTGRVVYHYLSGNQTRRLGFLNSQAPEPWVEIHPQAAARLGIATDEIGARADAARRRWS